jgi:hypothetical protein
MQSATHLPGDPDAPARRPVLEEALPMRTRLVLFLMALATIGGCHKAAPPIRFAPSDTDIARLRSEYALTPAERAALTPETLKLFTQDELDQIYKRLSAGPMPDGPFRGDLFFPRGARKDASVGELSAVGSEIVTKIAAMPAEQLGRAFWRGKVFFRSQGILRNRIEDLAFLKPIIPDPETIPKLTFDGQTTWLLFPAKLSCGNSLLDQANRSIVIDYARGSEVDGYREIPDKLAGPEGLDIRDEVRQVRPGLYLGRAYFRNQFRLNFSLLDPATAADTDAPAAQGDCSASQP